MLQLPLLLLALTFPRLAPLQSPQSYDVQIVDKISGLPIAGAKLWSIEEHPTPLTGEFWYSAKFLSDSAGRVDLSALKLSSSESWWYVDAPGYSPEAIFAKQPTSLIRLHPRS